MAAVDRKKFIDTSEISISKYLKDVRKINVLSADDEVVLAKEIQKGCKKAFDKLVNSNLRFVISVAKEYQGQGLPLSDLIAEGNYGLIKAAERFDHTKGFRFISYAVWWIKQSILQSLNDNSRTVRLPVNITSQITKTIEKIREFEQCNEREATPNDVDMHSLLQPSCGSLNDKINEDGDEVIEIIEDKSFLKPDESVLGDDVIKHELDRTMCVLSEREQHIVAMYYGLDGYPMTLEQIGDEFGLTKERIRQIKEKAIRKLRQNSSNLFQFIYD